MVECDASSPPRLFDFYGGPAAIERNTFLEFQPPEQLELCRASTEPGSIQRLSTELPVHAEDQEWEEREDIGTIPPALPSLPPPPPLELEAFETYDSFDGPLENAAPPQALGGGSSSSTSGPPTSLAEEGYSWRPAPPNGEHGFQSPFMTSPGSAPQRTTIAELEGCVAYEWRDASRQPFVVAAGSGAAMMQGEPASLAEPRFLPLPADMQMPMAPAELPQAPLAAPVVPPPPSRPAPSIEVPAEPGAPPLPPGESPGGAAHSKFEAPANDATAFEIARQPSGITCTVFGSIHHVSWQVDARKLESQDKQAVSPQFIIDLPVLGPQPFKIAIYPKITNDAKRGASFKKAKGKGKVVLKCEAQLPQDSPEIGFRVGIGRGEKMQPPRGPVAHNFYEQSMRGLAKNEEEWDFHAAVDESGTFVVSLALASSVALLATPQPVCWGGSAIVSAH